MKQKGHRQIKIYGVWDFLIIVDKMKPHLNGNVMAWLQQSTVNQIYHKDTCCSHGPVPQQGDDLIIQVL